VVGQEDTGAASRATLACVVAGIIPKLEHKSAMAETKATTRRVMTYTHFFRRKRRSVGSLGR
jgi:predicted Rossmann-fold nucleotide-binding protein